MVESCLCEPDTFTTREFPFRRATKGIRMQPHGAPGPPCLTSHLVFFLPCVGALMHPGGWHTLPLQDLREGPSLVRGGSLYQLPSIAGPDVMLPLISSCSPMRFLRAGIRCSGKSPKHLLLVAPGALGRCLCPDGVHLHPWQDLCEASRRSAHSIGALSRR